MKELSRVTNRELISATGSQSISVESPEWFEWLADNKSFRFGYDLEDGFTALKNSRGYWYAQRRVSGTLHQKCIGKDEKITWEVMTEANKALTLMAIDHRTEDRTSRHLRNGLVQTVQTLTNETSPSQEEIERLRVELEEANKQIARLEALAEGRGKDRDSIANLLARERDKHSAEMQDALDAIAKLKAKNKTSEGDYTTVRCRSGEQITLEMIEAVIHDKNWSTPIERHRQDPKTNVRYWALVKLLDELRES